MDIGGGGIVERGQRALCLTLESMKRHKLSPFVQYAGLTPPILSAYKRTLAGEL